MSIFNRFANTFSNRKPENIFYLHIPKCGGVSIGQAIAATFQTLNFRNDSGIINLNAPVSRKVIKATEGINYPFDTDDDYPILIFREKLLLYFMAQSNSKFISGHFLFSNIAYQEYGEKFSFVTVLRDPVKRWISSYFYNTLKADHQMKVDDSIEARLESHFGRSQGYQLVKFLGGANQEGDYTSPKAINRAKENLKRFAVVGFLENLDDFSKKFYNRFDVKLKIARKNQSPAPINYQNSALTPELHEKITAICDPDIQIYDYALSL